MTNDTPVTDAELDNIYGSDLYLRAVQTFAEDTEDAFRRFFAGDEGQSVEYFSHGLRRVSGQTVREAVMEYMEYSIPESAFFQMLRESQCPLVQEFKRTVVAEYIKQNSHDVALWRSE